MEATKKLIIKELREAREDLLNIKKEELSHRNIMSIWLPRWNSAFVKAEGVGGHLIRVNVAQYAGGYDSTQDFEVLNELRQRIVRLLEGAIQSVDSKQEVKPVLDTFIAKVKDTKLATLLKEFNNSKDVNPNLAAIGFRSILSLVIQARAKVIDPALALAHRDDIVPERDLREAIANKIFGEGETKLLRRHLEGVYKDTFDNIAHKPGVQHLIDKDDLEQAVLLLNKLLPLILD